MSEHDDPASAGEPLAFAYPCPVNPRGIPEEQCRSQTSRMHFNLTVCSRIECSCKFRVCRFCVSHGPPYGVVVDFSRGVCDFHLTHPEHEKRPALLEGMRRQDHEWEMRLSQEFGLETPSRRQRRVTAEHLPLAEVQMMNPAVAEALTRKDQGSRKPLYAPAAPKGQMRCWDAATEKYVPKNVLAVFRQIDGGLKAGKSFEEVGREAGLAKARVKYLLLLRKLTPETMAFVEESDKGGKPFGMMEMVYISSLRSDLQLETARRTASGQYVRADLQRILDTPGNRGPRGVSYE